MLRQDLTSTNAANKATERPLSAVEPGAQPSETVNRLDIQQSLNVLEELILESPRVPFSRRTLIDEDQLLEQLDRIRLNLPNVFQEAVQIVQQRDRLLSEAKQYAQEIVAAAEQEAARRLDDLGIVQQAEAQARQVKQQLEQDCEALRSQTRSEIEQWQDSAQQYWEQLKQQTESDCEALRQEADAYTADALQRIEQQLSDMLRIVRNGRQSLPTTPASGGSDSPRAQDSPTAKPKGPSAPSSEGGRSGRSRRPS